MLKALDYNGLSLQYFQDLNYCHYENILAVINREEEVIKHIPHIFFKNENIVLKILDRKDMS